MKKRIIEYLFLGILIVCHFVFWQTMHYGYLNYAYANAYFDTSFDLFRNAFVYCHMMQYVENFLLAFFRWSWLGSFILLLPVVAVYFIVRDIFKRLNFEAFKMFAFFSAVVMMISQHFVHFFLQKSLVVLFIITAIYFHIVLKDRRFQFFLLLGLLVAFLFLSKLEIAVLCVSCFAVEMLLSKDKQRYVLSVLYLCVAVVSFVFYVIEISRVPLFRVEMPILIIPQISFVLLMLVLSKIRNLNVAFGRKTSLLLYALVLVSIGLSFISNKELEEKELYARLDIALLNDDVDEVLSLAKKAKIGDADDWYPYTFYALAKKGQLAQSLFQYKVDVSNFLPEALPTFANKYSVLSICFYKNLGLLNEAMHQAFQMGISCEREDNFRSLCLLVDLNIARGDYRLVEKFLAKLEQTLVHTDFVRSRRAMIPTAKSEFAEVDFSEYLYINKDQFMNISYALFLAKNDSQFVKDYFLCSLLLTGEYDVFCNSYKELYTADCRKRVYAEALVMARDMGIFTTDFSVSAKVEQDWYVFKSILSNQMISRQEKAKRLLAFRNTWWHYYLQEYEYLF